MVRRYNRTELCDGVQMAIFLRPVFPASRMQHISDMHSKFALSHKSRSRSFKVSDFGTNRKIMYDFLLVINTNLPPILHRFRDIAFDIKIAIFGYPSCV